MMAEPDVALTDYGLALEGAAFAAFVGHGSCHPLRRWFALFFAAVGLAALAGGTVHGFFPGAGDPVGKILWTLSLLAIGVSALAAWTIGGRMLFAPWLATWIAVAAWAQLAAYSFAVAFMTQSFRAAIIAYGPAALFLLVAFVVAYRREHAPASLAGAAGLGLTFAASGMQQAGVALHPVYLTHNAVYHLVQAVALFMVFRGARGIVRG
jgi:hypothetical protein